MNIVLVLLLGGLWAVILLPRLLRERRESSAFGTVGAFERSMVRLGGGVPPRAGRTPVGPSAVQLRRQQVLQVLGGVTAATFLAALALGGWFLWLMTVVCAAGLGLYVAALRELAQEAALRRKVSRLPVREQPVVEHDQDDEGDQALEA